MKGNNMQNEKFIIRSVGRDSGKILREIVLESNDWKGKSLEDVREFFLSWCKSQPRKCQIVIFWDSDQGLQLLDSTCNPTRDPTNWKDILIAELHECLTDSPIFHRFGKPWRAKDLKIPKCKGWGRKKNRPIYINEWDRCKRWIDAGIYSDDGYKPELR